MDKLLKPDRLEVDPASSNAARQWKHWKTTFTNFLNHIKDLEEDSKLPILINHVSPDIYRLFIDCTNYNDAIRQLESVYVKPNNEIFNRHRLATRIQKPGETLDQYLDALKEIGRECDFKAVTADNNRDEYIRDSFIRGLHASGIRQRLLENLTLTLGDAYNQARSLEMAQVQAQTYQSSTPFIPPVAVADSSPPDLTFSPDAPSASIRPRAKEQACYFCGGSRHSRSICPAKKAVCKFCCKEGHLDKVCLSKKRQNTASTDYFAATVSAASPSSLTKATTTAFFNSHKVRALVDTGSALSFIDNALATKFRFKILTDNVKISMASSELVTNVAGSCIVDVKINGTKYPNSKIFVMKNLCADAIIGHDILRNFESVNFSFGGIKPSLQICSLAAASVPPVSLFSNLTPNCHPIATKSRKHSEHDAKFIESEIQKLLNEGIIEECQSPWRAQTLVVAREDGKKRMCINYAQTINQFTLLDAYPTPKIDELVATVAKNRVFSTVDLRSAYHQVPILEKDKPFTAFEACNKLFQFRRIPFGVTNGVPCFQRVMDTLIQREKLKGTFSYLDDITVCGRDQAEHDTNLDNFLSMVKKYNLTINTEKSKFSQTTISLLGYRISNGTMKPDPDRLKPLMSLPTPENGPSLQRALGMFSHFSKWVPRYSEKLRPIIECKTFPLSSKAVEAMENIKSDIAKSAVSIIDDNSVLRVETDASEFAIAATLTQEGRPVAFFSRTLSDSEQRHSAVEKEAYAIIESVRYWRHYLLGRHFQIVTDQRSVSFMFAQHKSKVKNEKILRWRLDLSCYKYDIIYRPGKQNSAADALSRVKTHTVSAVHSDSDLMMLHIALCHPGVTRFAHWVRVKNLPYSIEDVRRVTSSCDTCKELKPQFFKSDPGVLVKATTPFERLNIDFKGPLPRSSSTGCSYMLTVVDEYSRFPFAFPCRDLSSKTVIKHLTSLFSVFGSPAFIHSDRGTAFMSQEFKDFLLSRKIATSRTTAYNPQGNGQVEKYNGTIWNAVRLALHSKGLPLTDWELMLDDALHSIRSLLCTATNNTPHERMFSHVRRSSSGCSLPSWLCQPGNKVYMKRHVRNSKYDPAVDEVDLIEVNPEYAFVKLPDGRETTVSLKHLAPSGVRASGESSRASHDCNGDQETRIDSTEDPPLEAQGQQSADHQGAAPPLELPELRRSQRIRQKPQFFGDPVSH
ncbi:multicellular organismal development [Nesidiocoris tenuis]|uniref:RNA-directed DNA polymerase n=1 Tax=Nesidiocoris tenuis TaxID=355587 RepID=A0ABN7B0R6_9HEMI|nr:multicellular organismal development [Nesidiocoris tenuis]